MIGAREMAGPCPSNKFESGLTRAAWLAKLAGYGVVLVAVLLVGAEPLFSQSLPVRTETEVQRNISSRKDSLKSAPVEMQQRLTAKINELRTSVPGHGKIFFPVRNGEDARSFFDEKGFSTLEQVRLIGTTERGTLAAEMLSDFVGAFRLAFGAVISKAESEGDGDQSGNNASSDSREETLDTLLAGGGNAYLALAWPFLHFGSLEGPFRMVGYALPRYGIVLPALGSETDEILQNFDPALELHLQLRSDEDMFQFFLQGRVGYTFASEDLQGELGIDDDAFFLGQWTAGFTMGKILRVSFTGDFDPPEELEDSLSTRLSFQFVRPR
jgi:hypothetical protein